MSPGRRPTQDRSDRGGAKRDGARHGGGAGGGDRCRLKVISSQ